MSADSESRWLPLPQTFEGYLWTPADSPATWSHSPQLRIPETHCSESFYSSVCPISAKLLSCCEKRLCRQGLLEGLEDTKSALASAYSSLLHCQFPPAWEDKLLPLLALMYTGIWSHRGGYTLVQGLWVFSPTPLESGCHSHLSNSRFSLPWAWETLSQWHLVS